MILQDKNTKIRVNPTYMETKNELKGDLIFGFEQIDEVYINRSIKINLNAIFYLAKRCKVFIIDEHGYIVGRVKNYGYKR